MRVMKNYLLDLMQSRRVGSLLGDPVVKTDYHTMGACYEVLNVL